jgi:Flp pilus assembly protein TadD
MTNKVFVGRSRQLAVIREWIQRPNGGLVLITGAGGIGKSSLLQKVHEEYSIDNRFVVDYFDLSEQPLTMINQAVHLVDSLGKENFPEFNRKLSELNKVSEDVFPEDPEKEAMETWIEEAKSYVRLNKKRLVRIMDTYEIVSRYSLYGADWVGEVNKKLRDIPGTIFIIAGRDLLGDQDFLKEINPEFVRLFGEENILRIPLEGLDEAEMNEFFMECDSQRSIPHEMRRKLQLLTRGRPVLLSLAVQWLHNNIPLPIMVEKSYSELDHLIKRDDSRKALLDDFEFELVSKVREFQSPFDTAILYMAHIDRRMDSKLLSMLLNIDEGKSEEYLKALMEYSFIKVYIGSAPLKITLHDEMRELVNKHAWRYVDIRGEKRKELTEKVIEQYYQPQIAALNTQNQVKFQKTPKSLAQQWDADVRDQERWRLEAEVVYYYSKLSEADAFSVFDRAFYDKEVSNVRDEFLLDELKRAGLNKDKIALREADSLRRRGRVEEARDICQAMIAKDGLDAADLIHAFTALGSMEIDRNPGNAEKSFERALKLAADAEDFRVQVIVHNNMGQLFRKTGQFSKAAQQYEQALELARIYENEYVSSIRNNLAWMYCLNGDLERANTMCSLAIVEHRKRNQERRLAFAYLTMANICRYRGDVQNAKKYAKHAQKLFNKPEDYDGSAEVCRTLANISRHYFDFEDALQYINRGTLLVQNQNKNSYLLLASLYQLYGRTYRHYAEYLQEGTDGDEGGQESKVPSLYRDAIAALTVSIRFAQRAGNRWEVARSQIEIVLINLLRQTTFNEAEMNDYLEQVWKAAMALDDELLKCYVCENRAKIELRNARYAEAGYELGEAAYHLVKRDGYEATNAYTRLQTFLLNSAFDDKTRCIIVKGMRDQIQSQDYQSYPRLLTLIDLCGRILEAPGSESEA